MNEIERLQKIKELLKLYTEDDKAHPEIPNKENTQPSYQTGRQKTLINPTTGNYRFTEESSEKKAAFSSAAMLGFLTLLCEGLFLVIGYFLFR